MFPESRMMASHSGLGFFVYMLSLVSVGGVVNSVVSGSAPVPVAANVTEAAFGSMPDGTAVRLFTLTNAAGMEVRAITYGVILASIRVPDRQGRFDDVVIGHDNLDGYLTKSRFFGAVVGRYGNRIAGGHVSIDGRTYQLTLNNGPNHLHGGAKGFDKVVWNGEVRSDSRGPSVVFTHTSPDGHEGYPGTLAARVAYTVTDRNELIIEYSATTDKPTVLNITQHSYFNLAGDGSGDILGHRLTLHADRYTPVDANQIPTGELAPVEGTPLDFRRETSIGERIDADYPQLKMSGGYDHNFVLSRNGSGLAPAARVVDPKTGRTMDVSTTEPGIQFYSSNKLDGSMVGKGGHVYGSRTGFCLETQHFPDSPNRPNFPSTVLRPGEHYRSTTVFRFGVS
jgi:aldose 1-epimerase